MSNITEKTLNWARQHDWGLNAQLSASGVLHNLEDTSYNSDTEVRSTELISFTDRQELFAWAGY